MYDDLIEWMRKCVVTLREGGSSKPRIRAKGIGFWRAYRDYGYYATREAPVILDFTEIGKRTMPVITQRILVDVDDDIEEIAREIVDPWFDKFDVEEKLGMVWTI